MRLNALAARKPWISHYDLSITRHTRRTGIVVNELNTRLPKRRIILCGRFICSRRYTPYPSHIADVKLALVYGLNRSENTLHEGALLHTLSCLPTHHALALLTAV